MNRIITTLFTVCIIQLLVVNTTLSSEGEVKDCFENLREVDLKIFMTDHIAKNNQLSQTIASDFNMN